MSFQLSPLSSASTAGIPQASTEDGPERRRERTRASQLMKLLRNSDIAQRGADRLERSDTLLQAARLEQEAAARREQARETASSARDEAGQKRKAAQDRVASGLDEADAAEAQGKREAKARAAKTAASKKAAADKRAASRTATGASRSSWEALSTLPASWSAACWPGTPTWRWWARAR